MTPYGLCFNLSCLIGETNMKHDIFDLFARDAIGLLNTVERLNTSTNSSFPPHNIVQVDDTTYRVELAVAGYSEDDIAVVIENGKLKISGGKAPEDVTYLHRGIAFRNFQKEFLLSQDIEIGDAQLVNGLLVVTLKHIIPESKRPKSIPIRTSKKTLLTE